MSTVTQVEPGQTVHVDDAGAHVLADADLVITPGGPRRRSTVHLVEQGHRLARVDGELHLLDAASTLLTRFTLREPVGENVTPAFGSGWITFSSWLNGTGTPISSFTTTWTVPRAPSTHSGQTIFLFNGIEPNDGSHILQPVLQWGPSAAGGGNFWAVASWYVGGGNAFHSTLVPVNEGDVLVGVMTLNSQSGNSFNYTSTFTNVANTSLTVANNPQLTWATETLEAYNITRCSDYPATDTTPMTQIAIRTGATAPALNWSVNNSVTDCGQKTVIAVDGSTNGEVELSYRGEAGWARSDLTAVAGAPLAAGDPAGYTWDVDSTEHNVYRGYDLHIHELWFNGAWHHNDLTNATSAPFASSDPIGYTWSIDKTEHVVYRGLDGHIHELWFNGTWHHNDLTVAASAPLAASKPTGYTWAVDSTEHVVYLGIDTHIHELWFNGAWHHNDLTVAAAAPPATGVPAGYTWDVDKTEHVTYRGADGHIHELWFNGAWHHNDLTNAASGAPLSAGDPFGYTWSVDNTQHNVYRGVDGHIHELWFNNAWHHNDLTRAAGGPPLAGSDPIGYTWSVDSTEHVVYRGGDGRIHELWFNGVWNYNDLTSAAGNPGLAVGKPTGYTWSVDKTEHVVYRRVDNHIEELYR
ncbi:hypothetical protein [Kutzneria buriramensis]|uniref:Uncharacterized protein n=1 Tax=Kutzneria buriramensis TaxID=1045776 RepID=A0A3E0HI45_9PSEU|nr:hypothetical protein [Kutzneria buriramensis]REH45876.1 hypothetical protein BCF44_1078 [Kutzneria buriramensis]